MKQYFDNERLIVESKSGIISDSLLLRLDRAGYGLPIGKKQGTNTFADLRKLFTHINETLSYHDLRHTFATELYHLELLDAEGQETRSESAALIAVSERLGHADTKTTQVYIRLRKQMLMIEEVNHG
jgi:integrase